MGKGESQGFGDNFSSGFNILALHLQTVQGAYCLEMKTDVADNGNAHFNGGFCFFNVIVGDLKLYAIHRRLSDEPGGIAIIFSTPYWKDPKGISATTMVRPQAEPQ
jgi:hypothetical protein